MKKFTLVFSVLMAMFTTTMAQESIELTIYIFILKASVEYKLVKFKLQPFFLKFPLI